jgi:HEAT repeat protein
VSLLIDGPGYERANAVMVAFALLGTNAAPAIPDLVALMNDTNHVDRAMGALSGVGAPAFPQMLAALTNTNQTGRAMIPFYLREMARNVGTNACLPPLKAALQDPDPAVRTTAAGVLQILAPNLPTNAPAQ